MMGGTFYNIIRNVRKLADEAPQMRTQLQHYCYEIQGACQEVHRDMGPFLNEYMYQDALAICLEEHGFTGDDKQKEYCFMTRFHGREIKHPHRVDFLVKKNVFVECKAIDHLGTEQRQQLWNYMRLAKVPIGILYNFAPVKDECERYYLDPETQIMYMW